MAEAYIIDAVRTPRGIGKQGKGALAGVVDGDGHEPISEIGRLVHGPQLGHGGLTCNS